MKIMSEKYWKVRVWKFVKVEANLKSLGKLKKVSPWRVGDAHFVASFSQLGGEIDT